MDQQISTSDFDPDAWEGDYAELPPWRDALATGDDLCERAFASKNEAFTAGLYVGERDRLVPEDTDV